MVEGRVSCTVKLKFIQMGLSALNRGGHRCAIGPYEKEVAGPTGLSYYINLEQSNNICGQNLIRGLLIKGT